MSRPVTLALELDDTPLSTELRGFIDALVALSGGKLKSTVDDGEYEKGTNFISHGLLLCNSRCLLSHRRLPTGLPRQAGSSPPPGHVQSHLLFYNNH